MSEHEMDAEPVRLGVILPSFANQSDPAIAAAIESEEAGLHGAFVYDHLWPLGHPHQPAISAFPLLGALAASTSRIVLGTLVARIGLVRDRLLVQELATVATIGGERLIAGLGIGDQLSAPENLAYGLDYAPVGERRASLDAVLSALEALAIPTWVGGSSPITREIARRRRAVVNLWDSSVEECEQAARSGPISWAGHFPDDATTAATQIVDLRRAGARWIVYAWPGGLHELLTAARLARVAL